jgi:hypothetical protein
MSPMERNCAQCGKALDSVFTISLSGEAQDVEARLGFFPYRSCEENHERIYIYPEFGSDLRDFLFSDAIPKTKRPGGRLPRGDACARCGARLAWIRTPQLEFRLEPRLRHAPPFELVLRMPAVACSNCVTVQVLASTFGTNVNPLDAILAAIESGGITPT